jgi:3-methyladenine DNA glycosylase AlkD
MWLQRSAILFQLNYKDKTDTDLLTYIINPLSGSKEFFINKAIGWALRNYGKTNPDWVIEFTERTTLSSLSLREALRLIKK